MHNIHQLIVSHNCIIQECALELQSHTVQVRTYIYLLHRYLRKYNKLQPPQLTPLKRIPN